ncbi:hypothetical protein LPJ66_005367 [Kickxella alabastrina]|uniref:Uncharacterized protein n=1 Tax=Kickxella alabastrina TaxID=61397 RepID=A0ACC1IEF1_9FUNG|nr:hypothetical protein LPJ66_005367 [Kickxella alabastrina]
MDSETFRAWNKEAPELDANMRTLVAISTLASANRPSTIASIAQTHLKQLGNVSEQVFFVHQTRESILKMTSIMGTPKAINALSSFMTVIKPDDAIVHELSTATYPRSSTTPDYAETRARGQELFASIYGRHASRVESMLHSLYPDLAEVIIADSYGRLLSETYYLNGRDTELCAIGSLVPQDVPAQLKSHCIGATRLGASEEMVQGALRLAKFVFAKK